MIWFILAAIAAYLFTLVWVVCLMKTAAKPLPRPCSRPAAALPKVLTPCFRASRVPRKSTRELFRLNLHLLS